MRVVLDGFWWVEGPHSNRRVQREIINGWAEAFPNDELVLCVPQRDRAQVEAPPGVTVYPLRVPQHGAAVALELGRVASASGADAIFSHNFTPLRGRAVVFIHDVLFQSHPEWFTRAERAYFAPIPRLARRARAVLTSSASEAARIQRLNPRLRHVSPVGLAVSSELRSAVPRRPPLPGEVSSFLLTVGRLNVRKNLRTAIEAAARSGVISRSVPLVVVGEPDGRTAALGEVARAAARRGEVIFLGGVSDAELAWLYGNARLFVFLTLGEGFGLPPLEAGAFGCPALVSDIAVMREVLQGFGSYVDPTDVAAAASAIAAAIASPPTAIPPENQPTWEGVARNVRAAVAGVLGS